MAGPAIRALEFAAIPIAVGLGVLLYKYWRRRKERQREGIVSATTVNQTPVLFDRKVTGVGWATFGMFVLMIFGGIAIATVAPDSFFGRWLRVNHGFAPYLAICVVFATVVQTALAALGFPSLSSGPNPMRGKRRGRFEGSDAEGGEE
jgi:hypothetical protein